MTNSNYLLAFLMLFTLIGCSVDKKESKQVQISEIPQDIVKAYKNNPITFIPSSVFPTIGNKQAKAKIDVFFDPWCPPCRYFDKTIMELSKDPEYSQKFEGRFHVFPLKHFPNDKEAVLLHLEMVKRGLYINFRSQVVNQEINNYQDMLYLAESLAKTKLPLSLLEKNNAKIYEQQEKIATTDLALNHTPTVFLNNKEIPITPSIEVLKNLIDEVSK